MRTVILVPRRDDGGIRDELWAYCKARWQAEHPGWPIFEGYHRDGLFNRSMALNLAAEAAGDWDMAVIIDSDVLMDPDRVREAVAMAAYTGHMVLPYSTRSDLDEPSTERVMAGAGFEGVNFRKQYGNLVSSVFAVPRKLWDTIGGFDEKFKGAFDEAFRGWGAEDDAFYAAAKTFSGVDRLPGQVFHLFHPGAPRTRTAPAYRANAARSRRYTRGIGKPEVIRELQAEIKFILELPELPPVGIPRILHRVVPAITSPQVETWWHEFEEMHPGWELITHRDPLDPAEWPLTSAHWHKAENGAQFADLIRLEALLRFGGVYVDSDCEPIHPFDPLLQLHAFAAWEDERCVPNAVMGAVRGHPAIRACLDEMLTRLPGPTWPAGPGVLTDVLPWREDVLLLPPGSFYAVHYRDPQRDAKMSDPNLRKHNPWAFVLHHYAGSWLKTADKVAVG